MSFNKALNKSCDPVQSNPDFIKKLKRFFFSHKLKQPTHPPLKFNSTFINHTSSLKKLGLALGSKLTF